MNYWRSRRGLLRSEDSGPSARLQVFQDGAWIPTPWTLSDVSDETLEPASPPEGETPTSPAGGLVGGSPGGPRYWKVGADVMRTLSEGAFAAVDRWDGSGWVRTASIASDLLDQGAETISPAAAADLGARPDL